MTTQLTVYEKYSKHWPLIAGISIILSILFFIAYWTATDVLLEGYLRLTAFALFALGILSLFKIKDGQVEIHLSLDEDNVLDVIYKVRDHVIHKEQWTSTEIGAFRIDEMPNRSLYNDIMKSDRCLRFKRKNESEWIYFNKVQGRVVPFSEENAERIYQFLSRVVSIE